MRAIARLRAIGRVDLTTAPDGSQEGADIFGASVHRRDDRDLVYGMWLVARR